VASFLVSSVESVEDWCRRDVSRVCRVEVEAMLGSSWLIGGIIVSDASGGEAGAVFMLGV
jgi:hypothetical protein